MQAIEQSNEAIGSIKELLDKNKKGDVWEKGLDESDVAYLQAQIANAKAIQALAFAILELAKQTRDSSIRVSQVN